MTETMLVWRNRRGDAGWRSGPSPTGVRRKSFIPGARAGLERNFATV